MVNIVLRDRILVKKALAIAILAMEHQPDYPALRAASNLADTKKLLNWLCSPDEHRFYVRSAGTVLTGEAPGG